MNMGPMRSSHRDIEDFGVEHISRTATPTASPKYWQYVTAFLVIVVCVTIPILFVLVTNVKSDSKNYYLGSASVFTAVEGNSIVGGNAVSLDNTGSIQAGAGTSIYRNIVNIAAPCPKYLNMDAVANGAYLISYSDLSAKTTSLQVVSVGDNTPNTGTVVTTTTVSQTIADMVTLSPSTGLFVGVCQDQEVNADMDYVVAGVVDPVTLAISTLSVSVQYGDKYSTTPVITRLSDTEFAIAYYSGTPQKLMTRYGQVNPTTLEIFLSPEVEFCPDPNYSHYFDVVGLTSKTYALLFYNSNTSAPVDLYYGAGPLQAIYATVTAGVVKLSATSTLAQAESNSMPIFSLASTRLSDTSAVVVFADYLHNFGMQTQLIYVKNGLIAFGSSLLLSNAPSSGVINYSMMDLDVELTSDDGEFMVLYSDPSNNFAMTATMAKISASQEIERSSPDFLLNSGDASSTSKYTWGALAVSSSVPLAGRTGILSAVTNSDCSITPSVSFALMDELPGLFGTASPATTTSFSAGAAIEVVTNGVQNGWSSASRAALTTGAVYFTNTMGDVMKSSTYHGYETGDTEGYFFDTASNTIVTSAGRVGYAVSSDALYVQN